MRTCRDGGRGRTARSCGLRDRLQVGRSPSAARDPLAALLRSLSTVARNGTRPWYRAAPVPFSSIERLFQIIDIVHNGVGAFGLKQKHQVDVARVCRGRNPNERHPGGGPGPRQKQKRKVRGGGGPEEQNQKSPPRGPPPPPAPPPRYREKTTGPPGG